MRSHRRLRLTLLGLLPLMVTLLAGMPAGAVDPPGPFGKSGPADGATGLGVATQMSWNGSAGATSYEYCFDTINNGACDDSWNSTGTDTFVVESGLAYNTTHYWQVRAMNGTGSTYADGGTWWSFTTVAAAAPNDDFGAATAIGAVPYSTTQGVAGATLAVDDPTFTCVSGQKYRTVWYRYTAPSAQPVIIDTVGSDYDTVLAVWTGSRGSLTSVACNDDFGGTLRSAVEVVPTPGTTYYIEVASYGVAPTNSQLALNVTLTGSAPGAFAKWTPAEGATGAGVAIDLSWVWAPRGFLYEYCYDTTDNDACNGSWASAGVRNSATVTGLAYNTTYHWQVRASNSLGTTYADGGTWWSFTTVAAAPPNDDFGAATPIGAAPHSTTQNVAGATTAADDPTFTCTSGQKYRTVWYQYTAPSAQPLIVNTLGSDYDTVLGVWTGSRGSLSPIACSDDALGTAQSQVQFIPSPGTTYYIEAASYSASAVFSQLNLNLGAPLGAFAKMAPANGAAGVGVAPTLSWGAAAGATSYEYCYDTSNDGACDGTWASAGTATSVPLGTLNYDTTYYWQVEAVNNVTTLEANTGAWWSFTTGAPVLQEMVFYSDQEYDGWVLEQDEDSGKGGTFDAGVATARVGDDDADRQWRSILHFNTAALPDDAVITGVTVRIKKEGIVGTNPFDTHGYLVVDIKAGAYRDNPALEKLDFHAVGSRGNVGRFIKTPSAGWYRAPLRAVSYPLLNLAGTTQFRLRFATDDDNDGTADYLNFYTGNYSANAPQLIVTYYVP